MRTSPTLITTAAVAAASLLAGAGAAHAADAKPQPAKARSAAVAPDAAAARASTVAKANNALGAYYDAARREQVVVTSAGSKLTEASVDRAVGAKARVERRAIAKATVDTIQDRVSKRAWSPAAKHYNYASWLDLKTGKMVLKTNAPASVTAPLTKDYPGVIDRQVDTIRDSFSRFADIPPFWGGSSIKSGGSVCSSGFVVQKGGQRFLTTAGHCFPLGANVLTTGGNLSVGTVVQRGPFLRAVPVLRHGAHRREELRVVDLRRRGEQLRGQARQRRRRSGRRLHPVLPQRPDLAASSAGRRSRASTPRCAPQTGCKSPVISYTGNVSQPGDSGAPFYVYSVDGANVFIRGMNVASGATISFAEKWSRISSNLGVSIVT